LLNGNTNYNDAGRDRCVQDWTITVCLLTI
jgi:hypothetical protein